MASWVQRSEFENESAKLAMPVLSQTVKKCIHWLNKHKSDVVVKHCCMSLVSYENNVLCYNNDKYL